MRKSGKGAPSVALSLLLLFCMGCGQSMGGELPEWGVEQEIRIGSRDDEGVALTEVPFLTVDSLGRIYVAQPIDRCVKVFSQNGDLIRVIGREGEGPGEFRGIDAIGLLGDTLYVSDAGTRRVSFFGPDGSLLRTAPFNWPSIDGLFVPRSVDQIFSDGTVLVDPSFGSPNVAAGVITARPLLKMDMEGNILRTLAEISVENRVLAAVSGNRGLITAQPFADFPLLSFSRADDFFVILMRAVAGSPTQATMRLVEINSSGDTVLSTNVPYEPIPLPSEVVERVIDELAENLSESGPFDTPQFAREIIHDAVYLPEFYPPASELVVTQEGGILIRREDLNDPLARWDVLSPDGIPVAKFSLPRTARVLYASESHLWTTELDELDVPFVMRYRIPGQLEGE